MHYDADPAIELDRRQKRLHGGGKHLDGANFAAKFHKPLFFRFPWQLRHATACFLLSEIGDLAISRDQSYSYEILRVKGSRIRLLLLDLEVRDLITARASRHFFCGKVPFL